ncbi:hypothetical protein GCM10009678_42930 [Actinomadura kijaniata]
MRPGVGGEPHGVPPHAARGAGHQHALAGGDRGGPQRAERGQARRRQRRRLGEPDAVRDLGHRRRVDGHPLRERAVREQNDAGPGGRAGAVRRLPHDDPGRVEAQRRPGREASVARVVEVRVVERGVPDLDEHLSGTGDGVGDLPEADAVVSGRVDDEGARGHGVSRR